ncbi:MAG: rhamnosidase, partial [Candidatus Hydrogenedentota bacterium]
MSSITAGRLRVEYKVDPLGIDETSPRLFWIVQSNDRGQRQTAYQILVASSAESLAADQGDLWDTGKVVSDHNIQIVYSGTPLTSRMACWWKVRLWDRDGTEGPWSAPALWTMGLLAEEDWKGAWIGFDDPYPAAPDAPRDITFDGCTWVSLPEGKTGSQAEDAFHGYRGSITISEGRTIKHARALFSSGDQYTLFVNGQEAGKSDGRFWAYRRGSIHDVTALIKPGSNVLAIRARNWRHTPGIIGKLQIEFADGEPFAAAVDETWKAVPAPPSDFTVPSYDDSAWMPVRSVAKAHEDPWGPLTHGVLAPLPCPCLRRPFTTKSPVQTATVYITALGAYELRMNGRRISHDYLRPGWSDFSKRVYYQTYDVTDAIVKGDNVLGAYLGHGWYSGYLGWETRAGIYGKHPRLCAQLEITYTDGSSEIIATGDDWKAAHGPIVTSDIYQGETYDATQELPGWDAPGYDASAWKPVLKDTPKSGPCQAYPGVPVRPVRELSPASWKEVVPGTIIVDMGQNMVGWVRLRVTGPAGTTVRMQFGEILNPDGTMYVENLRGAAQENFYTLKGGGEEVWEPRFTFQGFRYVEM